MKLEETNLAGPSPLQIRTEAPAAIREEGLAARDARRGAPSGDRVELSSLSGRLAAALAADSGRRAARVASLGAEVQSGNYAIDAPGVGRALVAETLRASAEPASGQAGEPHK